MAAGLFESSSRGDPAARPPTDEPNQYQALASTAIAAIVLGLLSPLAFVDWWLAVVPILGFVLGLVALKSEPAGRGPAIAGVIMNGTMSPDPPIHLSVAAPVFD
jgi:hypothetical protein